jgi:hypothetical protein
VLAASVQSLHLLPASDDFYARIAFDRQPELKAGTLYHVVFTNPHPRPEENFVSLNAAFTVAAPKPLQPGWADEDWALLFRNRLHPVWALRRTPGTQEGFTPILEVLYGKGGAQGVGYIEFWMTAAKPIGGAARVGELFTVKGSARTVRGVAVRVRRVGGEGGLGAQVETPEGQVLGGGTSTGGPPPSPAGSLGGCAWMEVAFPAPIPLRPGGTYRLVLSSRSARFEAFPMRKGLDKGFSGATVFEEGYAQFNDGRRWAGWEQWGQKDRKDSDLQFYFHSYGLK